jgi:transposase Tn5 family protein
MESHTLKTLEKLETYPVVLKIQDTTELDYTSHKHTKGTGYLTQSSMTGFFVHSTLAVTEYGLPVGIIDQKVWARDNNEKGKTKQRRQKAIEQKESFKWLESEQNTKAMFLNSQIQVTIADRESDIYDFFALPREKNHHFLIRACQDRVIEHTEATLFQALDKMAVSGELSIEVARNKQSEKRQANLAVKYQSILFKCPVNAKKKFEPIKLNVIVIEEVDAPEDVEAIKWVLLTTLEIDSLESVLKYVRWYSYRWLIERFHYTLKSGCQIEKLELGSVDNLMNALAIYSIIAVNLLNLTYQTRKEPEASCETFFTKIEWKILYRYVNKGKAIPKEPPKLKEVVILVARLGGFLARKGDGFPGVKTLWKGYSKFQQILRDYQFFSSVENSQGFLTT